MDKIHIPSTVSGWNVFVSPRIDMFGPLKRDFFDPKILGSDPAAKFMTPGTHLRRWTNSVHVLWVVPLPSRHIVGFLGKNLIDTNKNSEGGWHKNLLVFHQLRNYCSLPMKHSWSKITQRNRRIPQRRMTTNRIGKQSMAGCSIWALQKQPKSVHKHPELPIYLSIHPCSDRSINLYIYMYSSYIFEYRAHENSRYVNGTWIMHVAVSAPKIRFVWFISVIQSAMNHPILAGSCQPVIVSG